LTRSSSTPNSAPSRREQKWSKKKSTSAPSDGFSATWIVSAKKRKPRKKKPGQKRWPLLQLRPTRPPQRRSFRPCTQPRQSVLLARKKSPSPPKPRTRIAQASAETPARRRRLFSTAVITATQRIAPRQRQLLIS
jgi:hypothetical protein